MSAFTGSRDDYPLAQGCLYYFPDALAWVAKCSLAGNRQHHDGATLHWDMSKSTAHADKIMRHLLQAGTDDTDGIPHSVKVAWRSLALAQQDLMQRKGASPPPNGRNYELIYESTFDPPRVHRFNPVNQKDEE